jgi:UDP-glucose 4-epimerase
MGKSVMIAGGAGFLGLNTAEQLAANGHHAVITTHRRNDAMALELASTSDRISLEACDLFNEFEVNELFSRYRFDTVIHTATAHMFAASRAGNFPTYRMLFNTLEAASNHDVQRFILSGSIVVYRGLRGPYTEDTPLPSDLQATEPSPLDFVPYFEATVKRVNELVALDYGLPITGWDRALAQGGQRRRQLEVVITRCPGQFGPRYTSMYSPISNCVHAAVRGGGVPSDRTPRDLLDAGYIKDSANALVALTEAERLAHRIYNVSSNISPTAHELLTTLYKVVPEAARNVGLPIPVPTKKTDDHLDISRIKSDVGWKPLFTLERALDDYATWLRSHDF